MNPIQSFVRDNQKRLNLLMLRQEFCYSLFLFASGMMINALAFVLKGYRVELIYLVIPFGLAILFFCIRYLLSHRNNRQAAEFADSFFDLKDALTSNLEFEEKHLASGFHQLQHEQTESLINGKKIADITVPFPKKIFITAMIMIIVSIWLCTWDDSPAVQNQRQREKANTELSLALNKQLKKQLAELMKKLDEEEKKELEKSKLPKMIKNLKPAKERKDLMRQYAKLEKELRKLTERSKLNQEEKMLAEIAKKLMKHQNSRQLGNKLSKKEYKKASEMLKKLQQQGKLQSKENQKKLSDLKKIANRMKDASQNFSQNKEGLKKSINNLSKAADKLSQQLKKLNQMQQQQQQQQSQNQQQKQQQQQQCQNQSQQCQQQSQKMNEQLGKMCKNLQNIDAKKKFFKKMNSMKQMLANAQKQMLAKPGSQMAMLGSQPQKGKGKGIGMGSDNSKNDKKSGVTDKGYDSKLIGQKGRGPSDVSIEEARSGSGKSSISTKAAARQYQFQLENFIKREDVPDIMKHGVKNYFNSIHNEESLQNYDSKKED